MAAIKLDVARWPLLVVTPPASSTNDELDAFFAAYDNAVRSRRQRFITILDLRYCQGMPAAQRQRLTSRMQASEDFTKVFCAGTALVFESQIMRALLTAILWMREPPTPIKVVSTVEEGVSWGEERLRNVKVA